MKVSHLSYSDITGGAARASYRIHHALLQAGVDSELLVDFASSGDWTVHESTTKFASNFGKLRRAFGENVFNCVFKSTNRILHSPAIINSGRVSKLNNSDSDIIHLHWVQGEMMSIAEIGRLKKPTVWTLHDMWAFCGAEHYTEEYRWRDGYSRHNRPDYESGLDLNRWVWSRKTKHWKQPIQIVTPSHWLGQCVRESSLMRDWPVSVIPNALNTDFWRPVEQSFARNLLSLPKDVPLLLFGAMGGGSDPRKGFDLLLDSLQYLRTELPELELVVFGQLRPKDSENLGFKVHYTGHLYDDISLRTVYSAADIFAVPSRQDNLPNTGVEAMACGTPVVAFDTCGLADIVNHQLTGYLAKAFDPEDFARGIKWTLDDGKRHSVLGENARQQAVAKFDSKVVAKQYLKLYLSIPNR